MVFTDHRSIKFTASSNCNTHVFKVLLDIHRFFTTFAQLNVWFILVWAIAGPLLCFSHWRQINYSSGVPKWATAQPRMKQAYQRSNIVISYDTFQDKGVIAVLFWTSSRMFVFLFSCFVLYKHLRVSLDMSPSSNEARGCATNICIQSMYMYNIWLITAPTISNILRATLKARVRVSGLLEKEGVCHYLFCSGQNVLRGQREKYTKAVDT